MTLDDCVRLGRTGQVAAAQAGIAKDPVLWQALKDHASFLDSVLATRGGERGSAGCVVTIERRDIVRAILGS